jgi:hypothetical protein
MNSEEEAIRRIVEEKTTLRLFVRDMGPLCWGDWLEELVDPAARADLAKLILDRDGEVTFDRGVLRWRRVVRCVRRHPALERIVEEHAQDHRMHTLRIVLSKRRIRTPEVKSAEWKDLFERLKTLLSGIGRTNTPDGCEFWVVSDEVEETTHKIEICSKAGLAAFTPDLVREIQTFLRYRRNEWAVLVALQLKEDPVLRWKHRGLLISSDQLEEHWDKALIRERLGLQFPW